MDAAGSSNASESTPARPAMLRRVGIVLAVLLVVAVVFLIWAHRQSYRVVAHWPQATSEQYGPGGPYHFMVVEGDRDWRGFPFSFGRNYFLLVGSEISGDQAGYRVDHSFHAPPGDVEAHIRNCSVEWAPLGVWFQEPSGQRLFIPKEAFTFGR